MGGRRIKWGAVALAAGIGFAAGACDMPAYRCATDAECAGAGEGAFCGPLGMCAVTDDDCESGASYAELSGSFAGQCVGVEDASDEPVGFEPDEGEDEPSRDDAGADGGEPGDDDDDAPTSEPEDEPDLPPADDDALPGETVEACDNGVLDPGETDVDCGGSCSACSECRGCAGASDCDAGLECLEGQCRLTGELYVDWIENCALTGVGLEPAVVDLPAGAYVARAVPSAGSKWAGDVPNGGETWGWWLECDGIDLDEMRTPHSDWWYATPEEAFDAIMQPELEVVHGGGTIECGLLDQICLDNRGETIVHFERVCP